MFWTRGYYATSVDDLVRATGVSRHGLYSEFRDKRGLFVAAVETYVETVVSPAFARVEAEGAKLADIRAYFDTQISLAVERGLPGPGCLVANTMTESGPHDEVFGALVRRHLDRLNSGFRNALQGSLASHGRQARRGCRRPRLLPDNRRARALVHFPLHAGAWSAQGICRSLAPTDRRKTYFMLKARFPTAAFVRACLAVSIWINVSEIFRYFVFVMPMTRETLAMVPDVAPMNLPVFLIWGLWDTLLVIMSVLLTWLYAQTFGANLRSAAIAGTLAWFFFFVLFWIAMLNMNLAKAETAAVALLLAWIELVVASLLAIQFLQALPDRVSAPAG